MKNAVNGMNQTSCDRSVSRRIVPPMLLVALVLPAGAVAGERAYGGTVSLGTDYTFRGVSQTMGGHSVQASAEISHSSGLYASAWTSNVDFVPDGEPDDGVRHEIDLTVGYSIDVGAHWSFDVELVRYLFPSEIASTNYDYTEIVAALRLPGKCSAVVAFSDDIDGTGANSRFYELGTSFELPVDVGLEIAYGYYDLRTAYGAAYSYGKVTLSRSLGAGTILVDYVSTYGGADIIFDSQMIGERYVLSVQFDW